MNIVFVRRQHSGRLLKFDDGVPAHGKKQKAIKVFPLHFSTLNFGA